MMALAPLSANWLQITMMMRLHQMAPPTTIRMKLTMVMEPKQTTMPQHH